MHARSAPTAGSTAAADSTGRTTRTRTAADSRHARHSLSVRRQMKWAVHSRPAHSLYEVGRQP
eukprot:scaffold6540_cov126-Isochrysis_galbana.AAC.3